RLPATTAAQLATVSETTDGVVVECFRDGPRTRVRVVSEGYETGWFVQFPRRIREPGARFVVEAVHGAPGGFYRVRGEIRRLM
ncbi:molybdenum metabolism regulator, partial [Streptomyces sp. IF17]|nr:molybdenum metabolism regulator [Streptomyces alkaliphilus]